jgi:hypothetical protein
MIRARNNRTNFYSSLLGNSQRANGLARYLSRDLFSVWSAQRKNRAVFSVRGPCREDMRDTGRGMVMSPRRGSIPRQTDRLTVSRNVTQTQTQKCAIVTVILRV